MVTTTPKPNKLTREIMARPSTAISKGSTYDNLGNMAPSFREQVLATYEGTRIGRQELMGEMLDDVEGAMWTLAMLDDARIPAETVPDMERVVVSIDPSGGDGPNSDEQGIIVAGKGVDGQFYILADRSCKLSPQGWASRAVAAYHEFQADRIVAERNYGGDMVQSIIKTVDNNVAVKTVTASRGKIQRAEPVAALYEQGRVKHPEVMAELEDQMITWTPIAGGSPDRMDALVWALTDLANGGGQGSAFLGAMKAQMEARGVEVPTNARNWRQVAADLKTTHKPTGR